MRLLPDAAGHDVVVEVELPAEAGKKTQVHMIALDSLSAAAKTEPTDVPCAEPVSPGTPHLDGMVGPVGLRVTRYVCRPAEA